MLSRTARLTGWRLAGVIAAAGAFVVASAGPGLAVTFGVPYEIPLDPNTPPPITAANFKTTGSCDGLVPPNEDGWHFVAPGNATIIVSLQVEFNYQGPYPTVYTMDRQGAFVATAAGANLLAAAALVVTVTGQPQVTALELANTCPAGTATPTPTDTPIGLPTGPPFFPRPTGLPTGFPSGFPTDFPTGFPTFTAAASGTFSPFSGSGSGSGSLLPTGQDTPIPASIPLVGTGAPPGVDHDVSVTPTCTASDPPASAATSTPTVTPTTTATATPTTSASATPTVSASATPTHSPSSTSTCGAAPTPTAVNGNLPVTG